MKDTFNFNIEGLIKAAAGGGFLDSVGRSLDAARRSQESSILASGTTLSPLAPGLTTPLKGREVIEGRGLTGMHNSNQPQTPAPAPAPAPAPTPAPVPAPRPNGPTLDDLKKITRAQMRKYRPHTAANDMLSEMDRYKTWMALYGKNRNASNADYRAWRSSLNQ